MSVARRSLAALRPTLGSLDQKANSPEQQRRLALAHWIARPDNPLTARVMVNRIWMYLFDRGLVNTPSNFGQSGDAPTHLELLDYLADPQAMVPGAQMPVRVDDAARRRDIIAYLERLRG